MQQPPPTMPPKRPSSPDDVDSPRKTQRGGWTPEEDKVIREHCKNKPKWPEIAEAVNQLEGSPGQRTAQAVRMRFSKVLKPEMELGSGLGEAEMTMLEQAVKEVNSGSEKWSCIAWRYSEIRKAMKAENDTKVVSKSMAKICWERKLAEEKKAGGGAKEES